MLRRGDRRLQLAIATVALALIAAPAAFADGEFCPTIKDWSVGDKTATVWWRMEDEQGNGVDENEIPDFGGYRVWMREVWKGEEFSLAIEFVLDEDDPGAAGYWPFDPLYAEPDSARDITGDFFQNAFPYQFSVTAFKESNPDSINYDCLHANAEVVGIVYPHAGIQSDLKSVQVIPNPYRSSADWEYGGQRRVTFVGLPAESTIRIYTVAADHVVTLEPDDQRDDQHDWDLRNKDGEDVAPGVYIWQVDAPDVGSDYGRLMVIK